MQNKKEELLKLKKEIQRIVSLEKKENLYSAMDLLELRRKEIRDKLLFFDSLKKEYGNIKNISMIKYSNGLSIFLDLFSLSFDRKLMLMYYFTNDAFAIDSSVSMNKDDTIIKSPAIANKFITEYYDMLMKLADYGKNNLIGDGLINTNSLYFDIYLERGNKLISIKNNSEMDDLFNLLFYLEQPNSFIDIKQKFLSKNGHYFKKILFEENDDFLRLFMERLQFSYEDISPNLCRQLTKKLSKW